MKSVVKRFVFESQKDDGSPMEGESVFEMFSHFCMTILWSIQDRQKTGGLLFAEIPTQGNDHHQKTLLSMICFRFRISFVFLIRLIGKKINLQSKTVRSTTFLVCLAPHCLQFVFRRWFCGLCCFSFVVTCVRFVSLVANQQVYGDV